MQSDKKIKRNKKYSLDEVKQFAINNGGECLSTKYINARSKLRWRCSEGHEWNAYLGIVENNKKKNWCPKCAGNTPYTLEDLQLFAKNRLGECLSNQYINKHTKYSWQCSNGHIWKASFHSLCRGDWCPNCHFNFKEEMSRLIFEKLFQEKFPRSRPKWLINTEGHQMELDGYCQKLSIGFEYNGIQHYQLTYFNENKTSALKKRKEDDITKVKLCKLNSVELVVIDYKEDLSKFAEKIKNRFKNLICYEGNIDFNEIYQHKSQLQRLKKLAKEKGGELLSETYQGGRTPLKWKCSKGHTWNAVPESLIFGKTWCPTCASNKKLTIGQMHEIAKTKGGKCLSKIYINNQTKLKWECSKGHQWNAMPSKVVLGQWCRICSYKEINKDKKLTIGQMDEIAKTKGGKCLSTIYVNSKTKLKWECSKGHQWDAMPIKVKNAGTWCPFCAGNRKIL